MLHVMIKTIKGDRHATQKHVHRKEIDLARDLVNVFPVNGFAIRTFATKITPYPKSGEFVDKNTALSILPGIPFVGGATYTGKAIQEAIDLLENER